MKVGLASDLHLEFGEMNPEFYEWRGDVLIIAGDLCEAKFTAGVRAQEFFERASDMAPRILYVLGNHEFYRSEIDRAKGKIQENLKEYTRFKILDGESIEIGDTLFYGDTYWTDFGRDPLAEFDASQRINDYRYIRYAKAGYRKLRTSDVRGINANSRYRLLNVLSGGKRTFVITHHAPSHLSVHPAYANEHRLNCAYANSDEAIMGEHDNLVHWVHGHIHYRKVYNCYGTQVACNPRGYTGERPAHLPPYEPLDIIL